MTGFEDNRLKSTHTERKTMTELDYKDEHQ